MLRATVGAVRPVLTTATPSRLSSALPAWVNAAPWLSPPRSSLNKAVLIGTVGKEPETHKTNAGQTLATFPVVTNEYYLKDGDWQQKAEWHNIVVYNPGFVKVAGGVTKGSSVFVEGSIAKSTYTDAQGQQRSSTSIVVGNKGDLRKLPAARKANTDGPDVESEFPDPMIGKK